MNQLLILGAGGHGKVVAETAEAGGWDKIALLDDRYMDMDGTLRWPVLDELARAGQYISDFSHAFVALGSGEMRLACLDTITELGFKIPVLAHPAAWISPSASIAGGSVVMAGATVQADSKIGRGCIVNTGANVDHDCHLEDGVHVCPGASLAGGVSVGRCSWLGIGCSVIQEVGIGANVMVGAGSAVIRDIDENLKVAGVPAKVIGSHV